MLKKISDLYKLIENQKTKKRLALAVAQDKHALDAVIKASDRNIIEPILVGNELEIKQIAEQNNYNISKLRIVNISDKTKAVEEAVKLVNNKQADILMKGNISTSVLLKAVLNKEWGLRKNELLSHIAIFEIPAYHKLLGLTDVAMNISPDIKAKLGILNNAVEYMNGIGISNPKVAIIAAAETINDKMQATVDAAIISKMAQRKQVKNCIVDGPLAFDNAIDKESAKHKAIISDVAGDADILLLPNIETGNVLYKALSFFGNSKIAAVILGASAPIVLTSRSDSNSTKLNSILLAAVANV